MYQNQSKLILGLSSLFITSCGYMYAHFFENISSVSRDVTVVNFNSWGSFAALTRPTLDNLQTNVSRAQSSLSNFSVLNSHLTGFLNAESYLAQNGLGVNTEIFPPNLTAFPEFKEFEEAKQTYSDKGLFNNISAVNSLTMADMLPLFYKVIGPKAENLPITPIRVLEKKPAIWNALAGENLNANKALFRTAKDYLASLNPVDFTIKDVTTSLNISNFSAKSFYTLSLMGNNKWQALVQCAKINYINPLNKQASTFVWPRVVSHELGSSNSNTIRRIVLKNTLFLGNSSDSPVELGGNELIEEVTRAPERIKVILIRNMLDNTWKHESYFYGREAKNTFNAKFVGFDRDNYNARHSITSYIPFADKVVLETEEDILEDGSTFGISSEQKEWFKNKSFLNNAFLPLPQSAHYRVLNLQFLDSKNNPFSIPAEELVFNANGIHALEYDNISAQLETVEQRAELEEPEFAFAEKKELNDFCQKLFN